MGDKSRKLTADALAALEYSKGIKSYESRIVEDATIDDLDEELIKLYANRLAPAVSSPLDLLHGRGLLEGKALTKLL